METMLVSISEAARIVGIGRDQAYDLVNKGRWPVVMIGRRKRKIRRADLLSMYGLTDASQKAPAPVTDEQAEPNSTPEVTE